MSYWIIDCNKYTKAYNAGDPGSIPGLGRSPGEGNGNPLQYSCLENPMAEEPGRLQSMGLQRVRHDWATFIFSFLFNVQFSCWVVSNSSWSHGPQHTRPPVHHQLLEFTQTHAHWVSNAIQSFHLLLYPSPPAFNLSQHQGLYKLISSLHRVAKVLEFQLPMNIQDWFPLGWTGWISLQSKVFSNTRVRKHQFFSAQLSLKSNSHIHTWC